MTTFEYKGYDSAGRVQGGLVEAEDLKDARKRRVFVEPGDEVCAFERGHDRQAIFQSIHRPVVTLAEALY